MVADLALPGDAGGVAADGLGNAKVNELELPLHHEEVGGLQIRVHYPGLVNRLDCLQQQADSRLWHVSVSHLPI